jgi:hypothetical protein
MLDITDNRPFTPTPMMTMNMISSSSVTPD